MLCDMLLYMSSWATSGLSIYRPVGHIGSDDRDTPGSDKWRSTPVSPLMLHVTLPSTAAVGGRYDPSWSSETDDDDDVGP